MLRRACQTRHFRPDIRTTDRSGTLGTCAGSPGPVATIPIDRACTGSKRAIVAVTPDRRRFRFGAMTSISSGINGFTHQDRLAQACGVPLATWSLLEVSSGGTAAAAGRQVGVLTEDAGAHILTSHSASATSSSMKAIQPVFEAGTVSSVRGRRFP